ncbi:MAG: hypothetical protein PHQ47_00590 [Candidatus Portnoybacteria bacterium]|nr:hypothetical protein [Candidatus Portnoybacteria bacterium]
MKKIYAGAFLTVISVLEIALRKTDWLENTNLLAFLIAFVGVTVFTFVAVMILVGVNTAVQRLAYREWGLSRLQRKLLSGSFFLSAVALIPGVFIFNIADHAYVLSILLAGALGGIIFFLVLAFFIRPDMPLRKLFL